MATTYLLSVTVLNRGSEESVNLPWRWQVDSRKPTLRDLRKKLGTHSGFAACLPEPGSQWFFVDASGKEIRVLEDEEVYDVTLWDAGREPESDGTAISFKVVAGEAEEAPPEEPPSAPGAAQLETTHVLVEVKEGDKQRLIFDKPAGELTLRELRVALDNSPDITFGRRAQFLTPDGSAVSTSAEAEKTVDWLDSAPTVEGDHGVFTVKIKTPEKPAVDLSKVDLNVSVEDLRGSGAIGGPNRDVGGDPPAGLNLDPPDLVKQVGWNDLDETLRAAVAVQKAKIFRGFNLPEVDELDESVDGLADSSSKGDKYRRLVEHSPQPLYEQPAEKILGDGLNELFSTETSGWSRAEVQLKRSFALSVSAKMNYADQVSAEAEYGHARASRSDRQQEAYFLSADIFVPKAVIRAPLKATGQVLEDAQVSVRPQFEDDVDKMRTPEALYRLLSNWGALIAGEVTVGGAIYLEEKKTELMNFDATSATDSFKAKVSGGNGVLTVGGGIAVSNQENWQAQFNEKFEDARLTALGGDPAAAAAKQVPTWITTLAEPKSWEAIAMTKYFPVYVILDESRRDRFLEVLGRAGRSDWTAQRVLPSLRFIDFDWYIGFGEGDLFDDLFGE